MKILTTNYLTCALRACKSHPNSFPLHFRDAELQQDSLPFNAAFIANILPRIDWPALLTTAAELGFTNLPAEKPDTVDEKAGMELHRILIETQVVEGKLVCGNCGHDMRINE
ncbi:hypothetical protein B9Z19DRAFT_1197135 [Tuber borchii]|uniref:Trm112p-domain-containing protein n=1 Tax=Tuber borchii TaxID=42251 RepID=A0A2T6ZC82_TUBBO|nr:hypothetical protein B9Z19DRAFT_1197135 [Tuber borchii]